MKNKLIRFMQGRYGNDTLNNHLLILSLILALTSLIFRIPYVNYVAIALLVLIYIRAFSKKRFKRAAEGRKYLKAIAPIKKRFKRLKEFPNYKYLKCPECKSEMRVPRKKGAILVTCPNCRAKFDAKS